MAAGGEAACGAHGGGGADGPAGPADGGEREQPEPGLWSGPHRRNLEDIQQALGHVLLEITENQVPVPVTNLFNSFVRLKLSC